MNARRTALLLTIALAAAPSTWAQQSPAPEFNGSPARSARAHATGRILIKWRDQTTRSMSASARLQKAGAIAGLKLSSAGPIDDGRETLVAEAGTPVSAIEQAVASLERDGGLEYASVEYRRSAHALTNDPMLTQQWYLLSVEPAATRADAAWDVTQGSSAVVVAVLDTGVRFDHEDLGNVGIGNGKLLPGYDFVSNPQVANDGGGRDADASDPGDWVTLADVNASPNDVLDEDCLNEGQPVSSSWHGTRVSGLIGAQTNNATGVAGNGWNTRILPVRVMGKCGGSDLDIMDGMRWAAGISVSGLTNLNPAKIINLSLGGEGPCTTAYQSTINAVIAAGVLVVASAGNEGTQVSAPANCNGVLGVAGIRHVGTKVGFSNLGPEVGIGAPGGNCVHTAPNSACLYSIDVATNHGTQGPTTNGYTNQLNYNVGTSFSAPMAASAAALLRAVNPALTPSQLISLLKESATPYPTNSSVRTCTVPTSTSEVQNEECVCTTQTCGAGMLNAGAAVVAAGKPLALFQTSGSLDVGTTLSIDASDSFASQGRTIVSHLWSVANVTGTAPTLANASAASTTLQLSAPSEFTLRLTVTDDQGTQDTKEVPLATTTPVPTTPPPTPPSTGGGITSSGGGGGAFGWELLALALFGAAAQRRRLRA